MSDHNVLSIKGRLTRDPEKRFTPQGAMKAEFAIANNRTHRDKNGGRKEAVGFFNCVAWGKVGDVIVNHFRKGDRILIGGRLQHRVWATDDGHKRSSVEIVVESFNFIESRREGDGGCMPEPEIQEKYPSLAEGNAENPFSDDDIPFFS